MSEKSNSDSKTPADSRICMVSLRNLERIVARCVDYEFEDVACEIDDVDLYTADSRFQYIWGDKVANQIARQLKIPTFNPCVKNLNIDKDYDLFVAICMFPRDLLTINSIKGWKERCKKTVCYIDEFWAGSFHLWSGHMKILSQFDHVLIGCNETVSPVQDIIKKPCYYMPAGIDTIRFCPYPDPPQRSIDVYSLGRRHEGTHKSLVKMAEQRKMFYIYDSVKNAETHDYLYHRELFANIAKRSRYFFVHHAKFNQTYETYGQEEIGFRYFEGAAAGTVMIGQPLESEMFDKYFNWPDAVIPFHFGTTDIVEFLEDLDAQPERLAKVQRENTIQSLLRHDWAYRWRQILDVSGLKPRPALAEREEQLNKLAAMVRENGIVLPEQPLNKEKCAI